MMTKQKLLKKKQNSIIINGILQIIFFIYVVFLKNLMTDLMTKDSICLLLSSFFYYRLPA